MCEGFCSVEVPPSPKDHAQEVGEFIDESTNWIVRGAVPEVTAETKEASGATFIAVTVTYPACETVLLPSAFLVVSVTV